ncbi:Degenerin deg-1 [Caenorhabditis elegans]|uniref:Degenerin deg-1 n=1 Tax=Caenorhabditis elegans TaxID=6239 RepID=DEG1_CAEEL|nr:Degenerin deg-1 [Caenorhabditis elegans]P24585.2 RecName: Full=Degenerin deg-1; AltName: Full=Degeneration of certain neurons protein 1 [Caenorhabditis elegans]AAA99524.1 degenerin [Caenorhabditis elegans]CCD67556.1 Degenerin deg-1 [Caenorhabditis elegans]|eukprot:NP_509311.1 Degenerin deg-1 [Caenorhabditis elegans]
MSNHHSKTKKTSMLGREDYIYSHDITNKNKKEKLNGASKNNDYNQDDDDETMKSKMMDFCDKTTAHGAKRVLIARNSFSKLMWGLIIFSFLLMFAYQASKLIFKFSAHEKITDISLKFDDVEFPAITFCNLNPYKKSLVMMVPSIRDTMDVYDNAKTHSKSEGEKKKPKVSRKQHSDASQQMVRELFAKEIEEGMVELKKSNKTLQSQNKSGRRRSQRSIENRRYEAIEAHCKCVGNIGMECIRFESPPRDPSSKCICTYDRDMEVAWPCFNISVWYDHECPLCHDDGYCESTLPSGTTSSDKWPCMCRNRGDTSERDDTPYCIGKAGVGKIEIRKLWLENNMTTTSTTTTTTTTPPPTTTSTTTTTTTTPPPTTTARPNQRAIVSNPETIKAMGFQGMTDGVAMLTRAKENLMFTMAALSDKQRIALSQSKHEFIEMCSFNGKECDIDEDFRLHVDPEFGNCFTFNYDVNNNYTSSRAGPMYGIRVLLFVNTSDYMSTSESSGVRLAIHPPTEYPFPDTFGYSAPVGFASSFGIKKKVMQRLPAPYGECVETKKVVDRNYIYAGYDYHPEGCHRSCFQNGLIDDCSCGDPRFPVPEGYRHCSAFNATARTCLEKNIGSVGDFHHITQKMDKCVCKQSCEEIIHEVTFSCSKWPSGATDLGDCDGMTESECEQYYRLNAAMIEVFYEQLNYELLQESEAYGLVNLIADFGGHLGLWLGFSVITVMEVCVLLVDMISLFFKSRHEEKLLRQSTKRKDVPEDKRQITVGSGRKSDAFVSI